MRRGGSQWGEEEERGGETDEQLCQVDFAPMGKGNLSVGEVEIKVTHTHTHTQKKAKKGKVSGVEGAGGGVEGRVITPGCTHPPLPHLTSLCLPPGAKR